VKENKSYYQYRFKITLSKFNDRDAFFEMFYKQSLASGTSQETFELAKSYSPMNTQ